MRHRVTLIMHSMPVLGRCNRKMTFRICSDSILRKKHMSVEPCQSLSYLRWSVWFLDDFLRLQWVNTDSVNHSISTSNLLQYTHNPAHGPTYLVSWEHARYQYMSALTSQVPVSFVTLLQFFLVLKPIIINSSIERQNTVIRWTRAMPSTSFSPPCSDSQLFQYCLSHRISYTRTI
jgi:hypothetical protein